MRPRRQLEKRLETALKARGWLFDRVEGLPPAFVRGEVFTPFYRLAVAGRSAGWYSFDGYVGVLDREFEAIWRKTHADRNQFPIMMHVANFDGLRGFAAVPNEFEEVAPQFAAAIDLFLSRLPRDRGEMRTAFEANELVGKALEGWNFFRPFPEGAALSLKFEEFRAFLDPRH